MVLPAELYFIIGVAAFMAVLGYGMEDAPPACTTTVATLRYCLETIEKSVRTYLQLHAHDLAPFPQKIHEFLVTAMNRGLREQPRLPQRSVGALARDHTQGEEHETQILSRGQPVQRDDNERPGEPGAGCRKIPSAAPAGRHPERCLRLRVAGPALPTRRLPFHARSGRRGSRSCAGSRAAVLSTLPPPAPRASSPPASPATAGPRRRRTQPPARRRTVRPEPGRRGTQRDPLWRGSGPGTGRQSTTRALPAGRADNGGWGGEQAEGGSSSLTLGGPWDFTVPPHPDRFAGPVSR